MTVKLLLLASQIFNHSVLEVHIQWQVPMMNSILIRKNNHQKVLIY